MHSLFTLFLIIQFFSHSQAATPKAPKAVPKAAPKNPKAPNLKGTFLTFDPPLLNLDRFTADEAPVAVSLKEKPNGPVSIYLEAPNLIFSECKLDFNTKNWDQKQTVKVSAIPYLTVAAANRKIKAKLCYCDKTNTELHKSCQDYNVDRSKGNGFSCNISGDPHYYSFARRLFHFQGLGAFYLVKSKNLCIQ